VGVQFPPPAFPKRGSL